MKLASLCILAALIWAATATAGTASNAWDTSIQGVYLPPCASGSMKHFELPSAYIERDNNIKIFDAMKAGGWTNLRYAFQYGEWIWSGDCTLGT